VLSAPTREGHHMASLFEPEEDEEAAVPEEGRRRRGAGGPGTQKSGPLWKLARGTKPSLRTALGSSSWQERDFVLDVDRGTLAYYAKGAAGVAKAYKGQVALAGGLVVAVDDATRKAFAFELTGCVDLEGKDRPLRLAATSQPEMDSWLVAIRATIKKHGVSTHAADTTAGGLATARSRLSSAPPRAGGGDDEGGADQHDQRSSAASHVVAAEDVYAKQELTRDAVARIKAQLADSKELADATAETLAAQGEQIDAVNRDATALNDNVDKADRNFDKLERWRVFGGRSKKKGARAAARAARDAQSSGDGGSPRDAAAPVAVSGGGGLDAAAGGPAEASSGKSVADRRRASRTNIAEGLSARDESDQAALDRIATNDDEINAGLDDIDAMLDDLGDTARALGATTKRHNAKLQTMTERVDTASSGVARINERAHYNVRYLS